MTYISKSMTNKLNIKQRRLRSNNFNSFGRSNCRVAETPNTLGSLHIPFYQNQGAFNSSSAKANKDLTKIHFRSFSSRKSCWLFKKKLKEKFHSLTNKKLTIRTNGRGTKIQYFYGAKI